MTIMVVTSGREPLAERWAEKWQAKTVVVAPNIDSILRLRRELRHFRPRCIHAWGQFAVWCVQVARIGIANLGPLKGYDVPKLPWTTREIASPLLPTAPQQPSRETAAAELGLDPVGPYIVLLGPLHRTLRAYLWAFDILKYVVPSLRLLVADCGPAASELAQFSRSLAQHDHRTHFLLGRGNPLAMADLVWVSDEAASRESLLLAMASKLPWLSRRSPWSEWAGGGQLIEAGKSFPYQLARTSQKLLTDHVARTALGLRVTARCAELERLAHSAPPRETVGAIPPADVSDNLQKFAA